MNTETTPSPTIQPSCTNNIWSVTPITLSFGDNLSVEIGHGFNRALDQSDPNNYFTCDFQQRPLFLFSSEVEYLFYLPSPILPNFYKTTAYNFFFSKTDAAGVYSEPELERTQRLANHPLKLLLNNIYLINQSPILSESTKLAILEQIYNQSISLFHSMFTQGVTQSCSIS